MSSATERLSRKFIGAVEDEWPVYSDRAEDYILGPSIGYGASSTVYAATYHRRNPSQELPCAVKVLDLDTLPPKSLKLLQRETQLMSLSKHPNVLRVRGSWMEGHKLYIAMRLMKSGSAADVMRYGWPGGMEEEVVRCILKQALEGLNYLHINGFIHRDVKAANMLIDDDGTVLLGDLGVAASLSDEDDPLLTHNKDPTHRRTVNFGEGLVTPRRGGPTPARPVGKRRSFVGTPCWMAPEVINGTRYDSSADIWSFGITAIELASGRAPRSREAPGQALLHTVQEPPPRLDRVGGQYQYSKGFEEIVSMCLGKDPSKRPSAAQLLQTPFFRGAKKKSYLVGTILRCLPPISERQERLRQPTIMTRRSIDSWDFSATHPSSPTTSIYKRPSEGAFKLDDDAHGRTGSPVSARGRARESLSRAHSRNASFVSSEHDVDPIIEEKNDSSNPSSPDSNPLVSVPTVIDAEIRSSSPTPLDLPPPSQALEVPSRPDFASSPSSSSFGTTASAQSSGSPSLSSITPSSAGSHQGQAPAIVASSPSLWQKLKGSGGEESDQEKEAGRKEKKKGFVGRVLAKTTSRTYNAVASGACGVEHDYVNGWLRHLICRHLQVMNAHLYTTIAI
ncbi:kinase-like protein [Neolentinus lepideus HHB14362 ss-1]|uniref:Kinase-like protein n=1 Tax=Neolentinus lepideus HHB14362 ss-1 TaxID=1314782 RepID=A0A165RGA3_9AGAM|nr:kinase-like protein [Neolentinus lepideus HHB14362 ss-1]